MLPEIHPAQEQPPLDADRKSEKLEVRSREGREIDGKLS
jgi:hypothetical protein